MARTDDVSIQSLKTAKEITTYLIEADGAGVTETAAHIDKPVSTTFEYLDTLSELGYLVKRDNQYHASTIFLSMGTKIRNDEPLYSVSKPRIDDLARELDLNVSLIKEEGGYGVMMYRNRVNESLQVEDRLGARNYLHYSGGGKAILAHLPQRRAREIIRRDGLEPLTENTITDEDALLEQLDEIRERGYAIGREESIVGMNQVAVPITVEGAHSLGAISVFGAASDLHGTVLTEEVPQKLRKTKDIIEANLEFRRYQSDEG